MAGAVVAGAVVAGAVVAGGANLEEVAVAVVVVVVVAWRESGEGSRAAEAERGNLAPPG